MGNPRRPLQYKINKINERKDNYRRSTNNSHKKFICLARKVLFKMCKSSDREFFEKAFEAYQNSRVYYFIILSHVKIRMASSQRENFKKNLTSLLMNKIRVYNEEISRTNNKNFINFRFEEIADIEFALKALTLYLDNKVEEAIEVIYKKEKGFILKRQQYQMAIGIVAELEERLKSYPQGPLFPYFKQKSRKKLTYKSKRNQDEEWIADQLIEEGFKFVPKKRNNQVSQEKAAPAQKSPLLFLESSYPTNAHFYPILFNYPDPQPQPFLQHSSFATTVSPHSNFNFYQPSLNHSFEMYEPSNNKMEYLIDFMRDPSECQVKKEAVQQDSFSCMLMKLQKDEEVVKKEFLPPRQTGETVKLNGSESDYLYKV